MQTSGAYEHKRAKAWFGNELRVLRDLGAQGWELCGAGLGQLYFRRPRNVSVGERPAWEYDRRTTTRFNDMQVIEVAAQEDWRLASAFGPYLYFIRPVGQASSR